MADDLITLEELLRSANNVKGYEASSIAEKELGSIYAFNKVLSVKPRKSEITVSMLIKGVTDMIGYGEAKRPVVAHKVMLRLYNVENEELTGDELVKRIRKEVPGYSDGRKFHKAKILEQVINGKEFFKDKVIVEVNRVLLKDRNVSVQEAKMSNWTFAIVDKNISAKSKVKVRCSCSSYFWTFQYVNGSNNVDIAGEKALKPYENFSDSKVKRNPNNSIGICKHLMLMIGMLMHENVIDKIQSGDSNPETVYSLNIEKFKKEGRITRSAFIDLSNKYRSDFRVRERQRNDRWYTPKKRKSAKKHRGTMASGFGSFVVNTAARQIRNSYKGKKKK